MLDAMNSAAVNSREAEPLSFAGFVGDGKVALRSTLVEEVGDVEKELTTA